MRHELQRALLDLERENESTTGRCRWPEERAPDASAACAVDCDAKGLAPAVARSGVFGVGLGASGGGGEKIGAGAAASSIVLGVGIGACGGGG